MAREIAINPGKCTGCSTCALTCSFFNYGEFDLTKSHILISKNDFEGTFRLSFLSTCRNCKQCAKVCPSGALRIVEIEHCPEKGGKQ